MQTLASKIDGKRVRIVEVNSLSPLSHVRIELKEQKRKERYPVLTDLHKEVAKDFYVEKVPAIFIVDTRGKIRFVGHMAPWKELKKVIDTCIEEDKKRKGD
jgi:alkyl hydroperoxide reductase subunit AhpC